MKSKTSTRNRSIPDDAKKVFSGIIFDVYQWKQKLFDGSFKTFEMLDRPDTVHVIAVTENKKFLLLDQEQPGSGLFLSIPAGRVDQGEKPIEAAERELFEETGYKARSFEPIYSFHPAGSKIDWTVYGFIARDCQKVGKQNTEAGEKIEVKEVDIDSFISSVLSKEFREIELSHEILRQNYLDKGLDKFINKLIG